MPTIAREIDALGGTSVDPVYAKGHSDAIEGAFQIAENADALVEELLECVSDLLDGRQLLGRWVDEAETLVRRARERRAR